MRKKAIIAIWGHGNQGKSETIKKIAKLIIQCYPTAITDPIQIDYTKDITVLISIGNIRIGIESKGDHVKEIDSSLDKFVATPCDLIICATRTSGGTVDFVSDICTQHNYDGIWATNFRSNEKNKDLLNQLSAEQIFQLVEELLKNRI